MDKKRQSKKIIYKKNDVLNFGESGGGEERVWKFGEYGEYSDEGGGELAKRKKKHLPYARRKILSIQMRLIAILSLNSLSNLRSRRSPKEEKLK
ncbi:predicted protein [Sclerotinia sclerotiorum 1980 UF-70]|uniref:Uncharacterized protein n=1 Tax=Sclerotinia sclerotiorum (strain ATCC 18683 / 1980 / Ss-1) TaxID=665079 RepID=A7F4G4_SCLS1|nr:predicted protein [Sclerotinia sclerotiorum 1980 UF-70]EDN97635.1 predicted protein [Sclerotinia sclerotiorum 1980 UF-70]